MNTSNLKMIPMLRFFWDNTQTKTLTWILVGVTIMGLVEMVGVASILPFLAVISKPELIETNLILNHAYQLSGLATTKQFMLLLGGLVFATLVLGNTFSALMTWCILRFSYGQGKIISLALLEKYLSQPYPFFLNRHTTHLSKNVLAEVDRLTTGIFLSTLQTISKSIVMICLMGLLIFIDPVFSLVAAGVLGGSYGLIYRFVRNKMIQAGKTATEQNLKRYQLVYEMMGCVKELKVLSRVYNFLPAYKQCSERYLKSETLSQLSPLATRYIIEAIAFGGMVLVAIMLIIKFEDITQFIPLLGLYALAGYRLMPALQQLYTSFSSLGYNRSALEIVYQEMQLKTPKLETNDVNQLPFNQALTLHNVSFQYPGSEKTVLHRVNIRIPKYSLVGLVGTSGAGKTTLVDLILGLLTPNHGSLLVDNEPIVEQLIPAWQRNIGYVPQSIALMDASVAENIALGIPKESIDIQAIERSAQLAELHDFVLSELPDGYETTIGERGVRLSGGQRQRIGIARALYHDPDLLIFDEATSALDNATEKVIMEAIKSLAHRKTIIIIAHRLNTVKDCDEIFVLNQGSLVGQGAFDVLLGENADFQSLAKAAVMTD